MSNLWLTSYRPYSKLIVQSNGQDALRLTGWRRVLFTPQLIFFNKGLITISKGVFREKFLLAEMCGAIKEDKDRSRVAMIFTKWANMRFVSLTTAVVFLITSTAWGLPALPEVGPDVSVPNVEIQIPQEMASVEETFRSQGHDRPLVIHIQNAHSSSEAQFQIESILRFLAEKRGVKVALVEGAVNQLDPSLLRVFPDAELNRRVNEYLATQGIISGVQLFLLSAGDDVRIFGVEDAELYRQNLTAFRDVMQNDSTIQQFLSQGTAILAKLEQKIFDDDLRDMVAKHKAYREHRLALLPYVDFLRAKAKTVLNIDLMRPESQFTWPALVRLAIVQNLAEIDRPGLETEFERLDERLRQSGLAEDIRAKLRDLKNRSVGKGQFSFRSSEPRALVEEIYLAGGRDILPIKEYPQVTNWLAREILGSELSGADLIHELERLSAMVFDRLVERPEEKDLLGVTEDFDLMGRALSLELSGAEYDRFKEMSTAMSFSAVTERLYALEQKAGVPASASGEIKYEASKIDSLLEAADRFYERARLRDAAMAENLERVIDREQVSAVALITGGFHTQGILSRLREKDFSYITITPRLGGNVDIDRINYISHLMNTRPNIFARAHLEPIIPEDMVPADVETMIDGRTELDRMAGARMWAIINALPELKVPASALDTFQGNRFVDVNVAERSNRWAVLRGFGAEVRIPVEGGLLDTEHASVKVLPKLPGEAEKRRLTGSLAPVQPTRMEEQQKVSQPSVILETRPRAVVETPSVPSEEPVSVSASPVQGFGVSAIEQVINENRVVPQTPEGIFNAQRRINDAIEAGKTRRELESTADFFSEVQALRETIGTLNLDLMQSLAILADRILSNAPSPGFEVFSADRRGADIFTLLTNALAEIEILKASIPPAKQVPATLFLELLAQQMNLSITRTFGLPQAPAKIRIIFRESFGNMTAASELERLPAPEERLVKGRLYTSDIFANELGPVRNGDDFVRESGFTGTLPVSDRPSWLHKGVSIRRFVEQGEAGEIDLLEITSRPGIVRVERVEEIGEAPEPTSPAGFGVAATPLLEQVEAPAARAPLPRPQTVATPPIAAQPPTIFDLPEHVLETPDLSSYTTDQLHEGVVQDFSRLIDEYDATSAEVLEVEAQIARTVTRRIHDLNRFVFEIRSRERPQFGIGSEGVSVETAEAGTLTDRAAYTNGMQESTLAALSNSGGVMVAYDGTLPGEDELSAYLSLFRSGVLTNSKLIIIVRTLVSEGAQFKAQVKRMAESLGVSAEQYQVVVTADARDFIKKIATGHNQVAYVTERERANHVSLIVRKADADKVMGVVYDGVTTIVHDIDPAVPNAKVYYHWVGFGAIRYALLKDQITDPVVRAMQGPFEQVRPGVVRFVTALTAQFQDQWTAIQQFLTSV